MKKRFRLLAVVSAATLLLGGCGTPLYELTDDEQNLIVTYAAYSLAKHNTYQKDGMTNAVLPEEDSQEESADTTQESSETEDGSSVASGSETTGGSQEANSISLAAAVGQESLKVSYRGYQVQDSYQEGNYVAVNPDIGKRLVVMKFKIKNPTDKNIELDTVSLDNTFYASFDGGDRVKETVSFFIQSLSSYEGVIKAGKSKTAVLLFQVPESQADSISSVELTVQLDDATYYVEL